MFLGRLDSEGYLHHMLELPIMAFKFIRTYLHPRIEGFSSSLLEIFLGPEHDFVGLTRGEFHLLFLGFF